LTDSARVANPTNTVVIGGGISGLACAFRLQQLGVDVTLLEASPRAGGVIATEEKNGFLFESGPQSFLATEGLLRLLRDAGLEKDLLTADARAPRFVMRHGKLEQVPMGPVPLLTTSLLGMGTKLRLIGEPFGHSRPPDAEESVADFVRRKFGSEILDYLVSPFVSGVYAGDPETLSWKSAFPAAYAWEVEHGSLVRGAFRSRSGERKPRPQLCSFRRGMSTLTLGLAEKLGSSLHTGTRVESLETAKREGAPAYNLSVSRDGTVEQMAARAVIVAAPAYTASQILRDILPNAAKCLSGIAYAPVAVVAEAYRRKQIGHPLRGFGFLVPRVEHLRTLGTVWNSSLFPGRGPDGTVVLTSFAGGATDPHIVEMESKAVAEIVNGEIGQVLSINGSPVEQSVWRWEKALPQYNLGHAERTAAIAQELTRAPGLFLAGNYLEGPSIGDCVSQGLKTAVAVRDYLARAPGSAPRL
jgi:oxygen-dependent protoporphyrinogen oxidase